MIPACLRGSTGIWVMLMLATLFGFGTAHDNGWGFALVMLAATFKAHLIVRYYMDLRSAPLAWRLVFDGLVAMSAATILGLRLMT